MKSSQETSFAFCGCFLVAGILLVCGWRMFWFLTDDAFIAFRYVSNSMLGYGYVWNPPPFQPVEGYTSFLWLVLLDIVWRVFGAAPPQSANYLSLLFSFLTLSVVATMAVRLDLGPHLSRFRILFAGLILLFLVSNRTFLTWSSSGLETALFTFLVIMWFFCCNFQRKSLFFWPFSMALLSALLSLARPDGLLYVVATLAIIGYLIITTRGHNRRVRMLSGAPFLLTLGHILWRHSFYGEWLPNTYYAKSVEMWPESGWRYALSFVLEYALWFWALVVVWPLWKRLTSRSRHRSTVAVGRAVARSSHESLLSARRAVLLVSTAAVLLNAAYYTLAIGGDHFEFRIYNHLLPLIVIGFVWGVSHLHCKAPVALGLTVAFLLLSLPVPWTHWALTHKLTQRADTYTMRVPVAPHWPGPLQWYARQFDNLQSWLIERHVCMRHQEHKIFLEEMLVAHPPRTEGLRLTAEKFPVIARYSTGVPGWVLPRICILDLFGLNDYVIARTPVLESEKRLLAHERRPPLQYVASLRPNVEIEDGEVIILPRRVELTAVEIAAIETWWKREIQLSVNRGD